MATRALPSPTKSNDISVTVAVATPRTKNIELWKFTGGGLLSTYIVGPTIHITSRG